MTKNSITSISLFYSSLYIILKKYSFYTVSCSHKYGSILLLFNFYAVYLFLFVMFEIIFFIFYFFPKPQSYTRRKNRTVLQIGTVLFHSSKSEPRRRRIPRRAASVTATTALRSSASISPKSSVSVLTSGGIKTTTSPTGRMNNPYSRAFKQTRAHSFAPRIGCFGFRILHKLNPDDQAALSCIAYMLQRSNTPKGLGHTGNLFLQACNHLVVAKYFPGCPALLREAS